MASVRDTGFEPVTSGWKPDVLAVKHQSRGACRERHTPQAFGYQVSLMPGVASPQGHYRVIAPGLVKPI